MPLISVYTSAESPAEEKAQALLRDLSSTVARLLGKLESYVMTCLVPGAPMTFGGSFDPACAIEIRSIGRLTKESAKRLSESVCDLVHDRLGVAKNRTYLVCTDVPAHLWGFDGSTFAG
jgi:phenylpyruvate tautomerase